MIDITDAAREQLANFMDQRKLEPGRFLRLAVPPLWEGEGDFGIVIDVMGAADMPIAYGNRTVLLISPDVVEAIPNSVLDFKIEDVPSPRFTLDVF